MAHRKTLTEQQLTILRWVAEGCPEAKMEGYAHRVSAAALRSRGLVKVSGRGPTWKAALTDAGRDYLANAAKPDAVPPRQPNTSVTQQLVDDVVAAGGTRRFPRKRWLEKGVDYENRARLAQEFGKVPVGKRLVACPVSDSEIKIALVDGPVVSQAPVPVPSRVAKYHPVVTQFKNRASRHEVSRAALARALRILEGLVREAERRGWRVEVAPDAAHRRQGGQVWTGKHDGHIVITAHDCATAIRVSEEGLPSRSYWDKKHGHWQHVPLGGSEWKTPPLTEYESGATGRLTLELISGWSGRQARWSDRSTAKLEERLPDLLAEIELRATERRERERERQREEEERQQAWEAALDSAAERYLEAQRAEALESQATRWRSAELLRAYCDAMEARYGDNPETRKWLAWARQHVLDLDPLASPPRTPERPESVPVDRLRPFLEGWDPYRPGRRTG